VNNVETEIITNMVIPGALTVWLCFLVQERGHIKIPGSSCSTLP
jgi:hypothetical protein